MLTLAASSFWPTSLGGWAAIVAVVVSAFNFKSIRQVHILVNGRLSKALEDIARLKDHTDLPERRVADIVNRPDTVLPVIIAQPVIATPVTGDKPPEKTPDA